MVLTAFQQSVLHTAGSTRRADSRVAVSTLWHFCQQGHIRLSPWKPLGIHSFIFTSSPGKFIPQEHCSRNSCPANLVPCTPCFDVCLFIHSSVHSQITPRAGPVQFTRLGTSVFVTICLSEGNFHLGETLKFEFVTSHTWWETSYRCPMQELSGLSQEPRGHLGQTVHSPWASISLPV